MYVGPGMWMSLDFLKALLSLVSLVDRTLLWCGVNKYCFLNKAKCFSIEAVRRGNWSDSFETHRWYWLQGYWILASDRLALCWEHWTCLDSCRAAPAGSLAGKWGRCWLCPQYWDKCGGQSSPHRAEDTSLQTWGHYENVITGLVRQASLIKFGKSLE